jgi:hypothetical protein
MKAPSKHRAESSAMTCRPSIRYLAIRLVITAGITLSSVSAISPKPEDETSADEMFQTFSKPIPGVDWDKMSPHFVQMIDRMFERNGWTDESDQYARKVASRIAALPPWDLPGRFGVLTEEVSGRYGLTPQQTTLFQRAVMRESFGMMVKHGPALWEQAQEALQGRAQGKPYTAEQIARWAKDADPVYREMEASIERVASELELTMPDEKKSVLEKDMAGFHKRQKAVKAMSQRWAKGLWKPDEWGLEDDPIQTGGVRASAEPQQPGAVPNPQTARPVAPLVAPAVASVAIPDHWVEHDPGTWIALVMEIGKRYRLDAGQMDTAWSIHAELVDRADRYSKLRTSELAAVPTVQRPTHEAYLPIRELFGELRDRLESLPTSAQREATGK